MMMWLAVRFVVFGLQDVIPYPAIVFLPVGAGRVPYRPVTSEKFVRASRRACISTAGRYTGRFGSRPEGGSNK